MFYLFIKILFQLKFKIAISKCCGSRKDHGQYLHTVSHQWIPNIFFIYNVGWSTILQFNDIYLSPIALKSKFYTNDPDKKNDLLKGIFFFSHPYIPKAAAAKVPLKSSVSISIYLVF